VKSQRAFGEALRRHRERSGITLDTIARQTKIGASMLAALERCDCSSWPTGIYSRSYVRDYASAVGLDPDDVASQFSACFAETAFPDRPAELAAPPTQAPCPEPLRLTLEVVPAARTRTIARRAAFVVLDLLLIGVLAAALRMTIVADLWMALAGSAIVCHALSLAGGGSGAAGLFARIFRGSSAPVPEQTPQETAVAEPA
jgi:hypothetical protein